MATILKRRRWPLAALALVTALALLVWLGGRESILQWTVQKIVDASGGGMTATGVRGSLYGAIHIDHLRYGAKERVIVADDIDIVWSPRRMIGRTIDIDRVRAGSLTMETLAASGESAKMPASLALPYGLQLHVAAAAIDRFAMVAGLARTEINHIRFKLSADQSQWLLQDAGAGTPWGALNATLTVAAQPPFAVNGNAGLLQANGQLTATAAGNLAALQLAVAAHGHEGDARAALTVAPFDAIMLRALTVDAAGIDPAQWDKQWPHADLTITAKAAVQAGGAVDGRFAIVNRADSGAIDQQRVPLRTVAAKLGGTLDALALSGVTIDLGAAGKFTGAGTIGGKAAGPDGKAGQAAFTLHTDRIDLKAIVSTLHASKIAGDITLATTGNAHTLNAKLAQDDLRLDLHAALDGSTVTVRQADLRARATVIKLAGAIDLAGKRTFKADGEAQHVNPANFGKYPAADVNAGFHLTGQADQDWRVAADFALRPSTLFQQPLSGRGTLQADHTHLHALDARLALGSNTLSARGNFGAPGDKLTWTVEAPQLAAAHAGLAGGLNAGGVATGTYAAPASSFMFDARGLHWDDAGSNKAVANDSVLHADGDVALRAGAAVVRVKGQARQFDPAALSNAAGVPSGRINGDFEADGTFGRDWRATLALRLQPSTLLGAPLSGHANVRADSTHIADADLDLQLAENRLSAHGKFGAPGDVLSWQLAAPRLAVLGPQFAGAVQADGTVSGTRDAPGAAMTLAARKLTLFGTHSIAAIDAKLQAPPAPGSAIDFHLALLDYRAPEPAMQSLTVDVKGNKDAHTVRVAMKNENFDADGELKGRWDKDDWRGVVQSLQNRGAAGFALQAPAPLHFHVDSAQAGIARLDQFSLNGAAIKVAGGSINLQTLTKTGSAWKAQGQAAGVPLAFAAQFAPVLRDNMAGDLTLGATWNFELDGALNGALRVFREKGDVTVGADTPLSLGLSVLDARVSAANNALRAQWDMQGTRGGTVHFDGGTQLMRQDGRWRLDGASPLTMKGSADMPSIAWLAPLTGQVGLELGGKLTLAMTGTGTLATPQLNGQLQGDQLTLNWANEGFKLRNGQLRAQLEGQQVLLQTLRFDGEQGSAHAEGTLRFGEGATGMQIKLTAEQLEVLARPDRVLVVSGQGSATLADKRLQLDGKFRADRAAIELAGQSGPTQSDDIVVVRGAKKAAAAAPSAIAVAIDVEADLGDQFHLKGKGLDARLGGTVRIRTQERAIARATGTIRVLEGTYLAYGQKLQIERGVLTFNGPLDNPGINILAVRKSEDAGVKAISASETNVEAGVEVRGTALAPSAKLVSTPNVADSEKLSWLVLGHGTEGVAGQELDLLGAAAGALLGSSQAASLQTRLAGTLGVDTIAMGRAKGLETAVLTVGKRISQRAYLTFERGASSASNLVKLNYALNQRLSLQAQTGATTAFDILYSWAFD